MSKASQNAHREAKKHIPTNEERILNMIKLLTDHGATKKELEGALSMKHQTVTARLSSLLDAGKIYMKDSDDLKERCSTWYATPSHLVDEYAEKQQRAKFAKWCERGVKNGYICKNQAGFIAMNYNEKQLTAEL